jgi:hypothetical protein
MFRRLRPGLVIAILGLGMLLASARHAAAQYPQQTPQSLQRFYYYPYYYFPHNYWPTYGPKWPEPVGAPHCKPPAYMAYPPFREPNWRYELWEPAPYYHGFHFWLDQF